MSGRRFGSTGCRGVALVTVLLILGLASTAAVALAARQVFDVRRTENVIDRDRAELVARGAETWAMQILLRDRRENETDTVNDIWAGSLDVLSPESGTILGSIEDLQGRFNLNNLLDAQGNLSAPDVKRLARLLQALELDEALAQAVGDWLDSDIDVSYPGGAEDQEYLALKPPYRSANARLISPRELLLIDGFEPAVYATLAPYVTVLPVRTAVNVNTASAVVLYAMLDDISLPEAEDLVAARGEEGYKNVAEFRGLQALEGRSVANVDVASQFFVAQFDVTLGRGHVQSYSVIQRGNVDARSGEATVLIRAEGRY